MTDIVPSPEDMYAGFKAAVDRKTLADTEFQLQANPETRDSGLTDEEAQRIIQERDRAQINYELQQDMSSRYLDLHRYELREQARSEAEAEGVPINLPDENGTGQA